MIVGLGSDLMNICRIEKTLHRHSDRFTKRVFTEVERNKSDMRKNRAASYAKRFAAKEACAKALGTGIAKGIWWRDMEVINLPCGKPTMKLHGGAKKQLQRILPEDYQSIIHLTITDDYPWAQAFVIIEAIPY